MAGLYHILDEVLLVTVFFTIFIYVSEVTIQNFHDVV